MTGSKVIELYQEVKCTKANQLVEDNEQNQPPAGKGISALPDPLPLDKAKEADANRESIDNIASIGLKNKDKVDASNKGAENDTRRVTQVSNYSLT